MGGATLVLLKVSLFQLSGHGNPQNDAMFNFISDSSSSILGLSNEVYTIYVVQEVSEKMGKIRKPNIQGDTYFLSPLYVTWGSNQDGALLTRIRYIQVFVSECNFCL